MLVCIDDAGSAGQPDEHVQDPAHPREALRRRGDQELLQDHLRHGLDSDVRGRFSPFPREGEVFVFNVGDMCKQEHTDRGTITYVSRRGEVMLFYV